MEIKNNITDKQRHNSAAFCLFFCRKFWLLFGYCLATKALKNAKHKKFQSSKNRIDKPFFKHYKFTQNGTIHIGKDEVSSSNLLISSIKSRLAAVMQGGFCLHFYLLFIQINIYFYNKYY